MKTHDDFKNIFYDFLFTYRQFLLHAYLHNKVDKEVYERNMPTWNTLLISLESGTALGLAKLLEKQEYFGRPFNSAELNLIAEKIKNLRDKFIAHNDTRKMRVRKSYLQENQLFGSDLVKIIDALKKRFLSYEKAHGLVPGVEAHFQLTTKITMEDLGKWLVFFRIKE